MMPPFFSKIAVALLLTLQLSYRVQQVQAFTPSLSSHRGCVKGARMSPPSLSTTTTGTTTALYAVDEGEGEEPKSGKRKVKKKKAATKKKAVKKKVTKKKVVKKKKKSSSTVMETTTPIEEVARATASPAAVVTDDSSASSTTSTTSASSTVSTALFTPPPPAASHHPDGQGPITSHKPRAGIDTSSLGDLTGGRPGAIIESEEQLERKAEIFKELEDGTRAYDKKTMSDYGTLVEDLEGEYDTDDPTAIDAATLGTWTIRDLQSKFEYEWDVDEGDADPNVVEMQQPGVRYKAGIDIDVAEGIEERYDPMFGSSHPQDERTMLGAAESYMINDATRNEDMLTPEFAPDDMEKEWNEDIVTFRKSMDILETYTDEFLPPDFKIPRHVAKWHGYPEPMSFPHKSEKNNRFLEDTPNPTDFSKLTPYQARRKAVELARAQNAEWLPPGKSQAYHASQREPYDKVGTLVGSLRPGYIDEALQTAIQPALDVLGSVAELLSMEGEDLTVFRFKYHGLMKHRHGMAAWTETLIRDCGVEVTGVIFEAGFRKRDMAYEGGDCWYPPSSQSILES